MKIFSIHTLQLHTTIDFPRFRWLCETLNAYGSPKVFHKEYCSYWYFCPMLDHGIRICAVPVRSRTTGRGLVIHLNVIFNPRRVVGPKHNAPAQIIDCTQLEHALHILFTELKTILPPDITDNLSLSRIDFTGDLKFKSQELANEYVKLFRKGRSIRRLQEVEVIDPIQNRYVSYEESWLLGCGSYSFQVYPKMVQMQNRKIPSADEAEGIVRFELRAGRPKIKSLIKKYGISLDGTLIDTIVALAYAVPVEEIKAISKAAVGNGDFYPLHILKKKIEKAPFQKRTKIKMLQLSEHLAHFSDADRLLEVGYLSKDDWRLLLTQFDSIGASPIPLPARFHFSVAPGVASWDQYFS